MKWLLPNNKIFDSTQASLVASWSNGLSYMEQEFEEENLYKTLRGGFFLLGNRIEGHSSGDSKVDRCLPLTPEQALQWCQRRHQEAAAAEHLAETLTPA